MFMGLFKSKEERERLQREEEKRLAQQKEEKLKREQEERERRARELELQRKKEEEKINSFTLKDLPLINQKLSEYDEKELRKALKETENDTFADWRVENIKTILREIDFWKRAKNRLTASDEYPFLYACSLMDEIVETLQQFSAVRTDEKRLEETYSAQKDYLPAEELDKLSNHYDELNKNQDLLFKQYQENLTKLNDAVTKAIRQEVKTKHPESTAELEPFSEAFTLKAMYDVVSVSDAANIWMRYSVLKYITDNGFLKPLLRKKRQLVYRDDYGEVRKERWRQELDDFSRRRDFEAINEICLSLPERFKTLLDKFDLVALWRFQNFGAEAINEDDFYWFTFWVDEEGRDVPAFDHAKKLSRLLEDLLEFYPDEETEKIERQEEVVENSTVSPLEFEQKIGRKFKILGWDSQVTKASGDQGADVVISKGDLRGVVQCKLYSQPVGNKAVQEVHAAKDYYEANFAVVVSNQSFTTSARMLANKLNVYLINEDEIKEFSELISSF